jgi:TPP-dependent pyruvate/acetoin dehydrogenase alpha subunit
LALFGSAAQANGDLHAALNFAAVNAANTVFMARGPLAGELSLVEVAPAWGIPATKVDGDDALAVYEALLVARERATSGQGPTLIDARLDAPARPLDAQALQAQGAFATEVEVGLKLEVAAEVAEALALARQAPPISEHTLFNDTFSDRPWFL